MQHDLRILSKFWGDMKDNPEEVLTSDQNFLQNDYDPKLAFSLVMSKSQKRKSKMAKSQISKFEKIKTCPSVDNEDYVSEHHLHLYILEYVGFGRKFKLGLCILSLLLLLLYFKFCYITLLYFPAFFA